MIERTEDRLGLCPERLAAESAYGAAEMLGRLVDERAIEPHVPVFDKSARDDGTFSRGDFNYDQEADIYVCPAGKVLTSTGTLVNDGATPYVTSRRERNEIEMLFAHLKRVQRLDRLRLRVRLVLKTSSYSLP